MSQNKKINPALIKRIIIEILIVFLIFLIIGIFDRNFLFYTRTLHYQFEYPDNQANVFPISPIAEETVITEQEGAYYQIPQQVVKNDRVKFGIKLPKNAIDDFTKAKVKLVFDPQLVEEIDVSVSSPDSNFNRKKVFYNKILEELDWPRINENRVVFWQRTKKFNNLQEFYQADPQLLQPQKEKINVATYFYLLNPTSFIEKNLAGKTPQNNKTSSPFLEGNNNFYTFLTHNSDLHLKVYKRDINWIKGADKMSIVVFDYQGHELKREEIEDDGDVERDLVTGREQIKEITIPNLEKGLYRINMGLDDAHTKIEVNQPYLVVSDSFRLVDNLYEFESEPITLYTNATSFRFPTWHSAASAQELNFNGTESLVLPKDREIGEYQYFNLSETKGVNEIKLQKNHLMIDAVDNKNSFFAFSRDTFFNPKPIKTKAFNKKMLEDEEIEYILTNYPLLQKEKGIYTTQREFDISDLEINDNQIIFNIISPGIKKQNREYKIQSIEVWLEK